MHTDADSILDIAIQKGALMFGEFQLSDGGMSPYYFDGRIVTLDPQRSYHVARDFLHQIRESGPSAVVGPELGAVPIVSAVALLSYHDAGLGPVDIQVSSQANR